MVRWRDFDPKVMTLLFITVNWSFSISAIVISTIPFLFSQWTLIRTFLPDNLASISGNAIEPYSVSTVESLDLFTTTTDSMVFWLACSSRNLTLSCKCFRYLIVPPSTDALSVYKPNYHHKKHQCTKMTMNYESTKIGMDQAQIGMTGPIKTNLSKMMIMYLLEARDEGRQSNEALGQLLSASAFSDYVVSRLWNTTWHVPLTLSQ